MLAITLFLYSNSEEGATWWDILLFLDENNSMDSSSKWPWSWGEFRIGTMGISLISKGLCCGCPKCTASHRTEIRAVAFCKWSSNSQHGCTFSLVQLSQQVWTWILQEAHPACKQYIDEQQNPTLGPLFPSAYRQRLAQIIPDEHIWMLS